VAENRLDALHRRAGATPIAYRFNRSVVVVRDTLALHDALLGRDITVADSPALRAHALNARRRPSAAGIQLRKEYPASPRKIDAIVAGLIAHAVMLEARRTGLDEPVAAFIPRRIR
jgi:hypothetical protein